MDNTDPNTPEQQNESEGSGISWLWGLGLLALGAAMILWPEAMADEKPRRTIGKLLAMVWGMPGGIGSAVIGAAVLGFGFFKK